MNLTINGAAGFLSKILQNMVKRYMGNLTDDRLVY